MDAATFVFEKWEKETREPVMHCWVKSIVLPESVTASVESFHADYRK